MERLSRNAATNTVARYFRDIKLMEEEKQKILERYKGAIAAEPTVDGGGTQTGDPERRHLDMEWLTTQSPLSQRIEAVGHAFSELKHNLWLWGMNEETQENTVKAIVAYCDNRRDYSFYGIQKSYKLTCEIAQFKRYKASVIARVGQLLQLET